MSLDARIRRLERSPDPADRARLERERARAGTCATHGYKGCEQCAHKARTARIGRLLAGAVASGDIRTPLPACDWDGADWTHECMSDSCDHAEDDKAYSPWVAYGQVEDWPLCEKCEGCDTCIRAAQDASQAYALWEGIADRLARGEWDGALKDARAAASIESEWGDDPAYGGCAADLLHMYARAAGVDLLVEEPKLRKGVTVCDWLIDLRTEEAWMRRDKEEEDGED